MVTCTRLTFGARVLWSGLPHICELPSHFVSTYDILQVSMLSATWGAGRRTLKGMTSLRKALGTWSNRSIRVRASHRTDRPASLRLPRPYGNFWQGHPDSMTLFLLTSFSKLHKQQSASSTCVSVFRSYCHSLCAIYTLLISGSL